MKDSRNNQIRLLLAILLIAYTLPMLAGCAAPTQPSSPGYVEAGPNAAPAKKGKIAGAEAP